MPPDTILNSLVLHFRPKRVPASTLRFTLSFGLGGMAFLLAAVQLATGLLLKLVYEPVPSRAYESILILSDDLVFGHFVRNIHHWSANLLVLVVFLHFLRVFFTGACFGPRAINWLVGLGLFLLILASNFTGYLLPWDQLAYWAVTICLHMLSYVPQVGPKLQVLFLTGGEIGPSALMFFYWIHTAFLPLLLVACLFYHFWRVRKAGGLVVAPANTKNAAPPARVPAIPHLLTRELVTGLVLLAVVCLVSALFDAPLGEPANPGLSPNPAKAPWYFGGAQELLVHFHPVVAVLVIPGLVLAGLLVLPFVSSWKSSPDVWFGSGQGKKAALAAMACALALVPGLILLSNMNLGLASGLSPLIGQGLIPLSICLALAAAWYWFMKKSMGLSSSEAFCALFVFFCTALAVLTIVNIWFRGPSMTLAWPWAAGPAAGL